MRSKRDFCRWAALGALLACAASFAACGDDVATPPAADGVTSGDQPGAAGAGTNGAAGAGGAASTGAAGSNAAGSDSGAGEAPGVGIDLDGPDAGVSGAAGAAAAGSAGAAGSAATDPACASDGDADGVGDCDDGCPEDEFKAEPGPCGCGVADTDLDVDGTLDCREGCPNDPAKLEPGVCGCGVAESDSDQDGTLDCEDGCPFDGALVTPGPCGCGAPANLPLCLRHRYSFDGAGSVVTDSVGNEDGAVVNAALSGNGTLVLQGGATDQFVNLPANIISRLGVSATIEAWSTWTGAGGPWQRLFDFGSSELAPGQQGTGVTYLFVTPSNTINTHLRAAYTNAGPGAERTVNAATAMPFGVQAHIALVIDGEAQTLTMYQNGNAVDVAAATLDTTLVGLNDVNNWIGRSQFAPDEEYQGVLDEFRIYSVARSAQQVAAEFAAGPNVLPAQ
ncbi:MAG TPA: LamG domain-containing protein [Polyangiaceae bacterium]|nr:LamG domain-containing protein [Polyangiaceae bacterium]